MPRGFSARLKHAVPSLSMTIFGALAWGVMMAVSMAIALYRQNEFDTSHLSTLALLYFAGGTLAWPFALVASRFLAFRAPVTLAFIVALILLALATLAMTAFLFAMVYRSFYAQWHAPFGTLTWAFQFLFTSASAVYQFAVLGSRLFLPLGPLFLIATAAYLGKRIR